MSQEWDYRDAYDYCCDTDKVRDQYAAGNSAARAAVIFRLCRALSKPGHRTVWAGEVMNNPEQGRRDLLHMLRAEMYDLQAWSGPSEYHQRRYRNVRARLAAFISEAQLLGVSPDEYGTGAS